MEEHPFADLLPELYENDPILLTLVGVFEEQYLKIEHQIDALPEKLYDPRHTPDGFLDFLGSLVGLRNENGLFLPAQMRALIPAAYRIQRKKGTRQALSELLSCYLTSLCGHPVSPVILEYEDWQRAEIPPELAAAYPALYSAEQDFAVLLPPEPLLQTAEEQERLQKLASLYCPAVSTPHILVLGTEINLGNFNYLDVNTYL